MSTPSLDDIELAAEWLRFNDGDNGEAEACKRVANWLSNYCQAKIERTAARKARIPVDALRKRIEQDSHPSTEK